MKPPDPWWPSENQRFEISRSGGIDGLRRMLDRCWRAARLNYKAAGAPFGPSQRGIEVWIHYGTRTTIN